MSLDRETTIYPITPSALQTMMNHFRPQKSAAWETGRIATKVKMFLMVPNHCDTLASPSLVAMPRASIPPPTMEMSWAVLVKQTAYMKQQTVSRATKQRIYMTYSHRYDSSNMNLSWFHENFFWNMFLSLCFFFVVHIVALRSAFLYFMETRNR